MASNVWTKSLNEFPQSTTSYNGVLNTYMEENKATRVTSVLRTAFDLSNNLNDGRTLSYGDFTNSVSGCPAAGCRLFVNDGDATTSFVSRFRGFLNVTPDMTGKALHFGFYTDDAVSLTIFDRAQATYQVINRPPQLGAPTWRTTNTVTFNKSGLYGVEVIYSQIVDHAALEFSTFEGAFTDFERTPSTPPIVNLKDAGFTLVTPEMFFQTETGRPSFPSDLTQCTQCNRQFSNAPGNGDCGQNSGLYCNSAALCAPCDTSRLCGPSCSPCGQSTPFCVNVNGTFTCVECTSDSECAGVCDLTTNTCTGQCKDDSQCANGRCDLTDNMCRGCNEDTDCPTTGRCDLTDNVCRGCNDNGDCPTGQVCDVPASACVQCTANEHCPTGQVCALDLKQCRDCAQDADCPRGTQCVENVCTTCASDDACAGNSCNCCPTGTQCAAPTPGAPPSCVECTSDSQCAEGLQCDTANGRCVQALAECNTSDRCGPGCVRCPAERSFCLDGKVCVECRTDLECGDGRFCLSGECATCTTERHCGNRCEACAPDAPFCLTDGTVAGSSCVQCRNDADCPGGTCDTTTRTCQQASATACAGGCAAGTVCNGTACVECFADAHCPCGGSCDTATGTCTTSCDESSDCLGVQHCSASTQQCERGRRKPGMTPQGGAFCCGTTTDLTPPGLLFAAAMLAVALLLRRSHRAP